MKVRIKFAKSGVMKYVGHLDMVRYFQKAMRRAGIDISYTAGFSPHQIMSFAQPLGVGLYSEGEYIDIETAGGLTSREAVDALNAVMADGVRILSYRKLPDDAGNAMSIVARADYLVQFSRPLDADRAERFFRGTEPIEVEKKSKRGVTTVNIRPMVSGWELRDENRSLWLRLSAGSASNCKPELVLDALALADIIEKNEAVQITRLELYADTGTKQQPVCTPLEDLGEDIV